MSHKSLVFNLKDDCKLIRSSFLNHMFHRITNHKMHLFILTVRVPVLISSVEWIRSFRRHQTMMDWIRYRKRRFLGLGLILILICASILLITLRCTRNTTSTSENTPGNYKPRDCKCEFPFLKHVKADPGRISLLLTPYIENGEIGQARLLSYVGNWKGIESYSGLLTVNESFNSNLFFWFFPSESGFPVQKSDSKPAPFILYIQGGPSLSSLLGLFMESGPFKITKIDDTFDLHRNGYSWTRKHSMLYIDSPVGTGFSFANSSDAYAINQEDVARDLYTALFQFLNLFPELRAADFYIMGTSYAGKYIPALAYKIHLENVRIPDDRTINLKGLAIGSGYFHFEGLISGAVSTYYHNIGFLDDVQYAKYSEAERVHSEYFRVKNYTEARNIISARRLIQLYAGFNNFLGGSALQLNTPPLDFQDFLKYPCIQTALHVGRANFSLLNWEVFDKFEDMDYMTSSQFEIEQLLDADYRILIYNAQFDVIIPHTVVENFVANLTWNGGIEFAKSDRLLWVIDNEVAGFVTETNSTRLTMVLLRNAGHTACYDQPSWCYDMIDRFIRKESFTAFKLKMELDDGIS